MKKSFTLIELLIVIAIIGILAAVILTAVNSARNKAKLVTGESSLSSVTSALAICEIDGGLPNSPTGAAVLQGTGGNKICDSDPAVLYPSLKNGWIWLGIGPSGNYYTAEAVCPAPTCGSQDVYGHCDIAGCVFNNEVPTTIVFLPVFEWSDIPSPDSSPSGSRVYAATINEYFRPFTVTCTKDDVPFPAEVMSPDSLTQGCRPTGIPGQTYTIVVATNKPGKTSVSRSWQWTVL